MTSSRMEALSDGVIAIVITLMVFKIQAPADASWAGLVQVLPSVATYLLSFVYLAIYWNNHHHLLQASDRVTGRVLWANMHLLFWLSLLPFTTEWVNVAGVKNVPVSTYGIVLLMAAIAYRILQSSLIKAHGPESKLSQAIGSDWKGISSVIAYTVGFGLASILPLVSLILFAAVALVWLIPDRRIERLVDLCERPQS